MEELLFLTSQTDFLRNGLILYSGVNIAWLLLFCGNPSQTQSCWRTKSQYTLWTWPVNKAPPHPSFLDFLSSRDPSLLLPRSRFSTFLCLFNLALLTLISAPVPVLVLSSKLPHPFLLSSIFLSVLKSLWLNCVALTQTDENRQGRL